MIVVDASVAAKWVLFEPDHQKARGLLAGGDPLCAPALIRVEVAAAISRKLRLGDATRQQALASMATWERLLASGTLALTPDDLDLPEAFRFALEIGHPLQDCLYLRRRREGRRRPNPGLCRTGSVGSSSVTQTALLLRIPVRILSRTVGRLLSKETGEPAA